LLLKLLSTTIPLPFTFTMLTPGGPVELSPQVLKECLQYIKENFEKKYADNITNGVYDSRDLQRLHTDEDFARQYIRGRDRLDEGVDLMHHSFKFRKDMKLNDTNEDTFTRDLWEVGGIFFHGRDNQGQRIFYLNVRCHRRDSPPERQHAEKLGLVYGLERAFKENPKQIVVCLDMSSTGIANLDIDFVKYILTCFKFYFPTFLAYFLIFDMPWIFNAAWKVIKQWLSAEAASRIKFVTKGNVQDYINADNLPVHMGGTDEFKFEYYYGICNDPLYPEDVEASSAQKKVTFQEAISSSPPSTPPILDVNANLAPTSMNSSLRLRNISNNAGDGQSVSRLSSRDSHVGKLLTISPADELRFVLTSDSDASEVITLTNRLSHAVAFKVKTTSPEKYRVRPSAGLVSPGSKEVVHVYLVNELSDNVSKDKFLVMATDASGKDTSDLTKLWKETPRDQMTEHKLRCHAEKATVNSMESKKSRDRSGSLRDTGNRGLEAKIEHLHKQNEALQHQLHLVLVIQVMTALIFLLILFSYSCWGEELFTRFLRLPFDFCGDSYGRKC